MAWKCNRLALGNANRWHGRAHTWQSRQAPLGNLPALLLHLWCSKVVFSDGHCPQFAPLAKSALPGNRTKTEALCCQAREHSSKATLGLFVMVPAKGTVKWNQLITRSSKETGRDREQLKMPIGKGQGRREQPKSSLKDHKNTKKRAQSPFKRGLQTIFQDKTSVEKTLPICCWGSLGRVPGERSTFSLASMAWWPGSTMSQYSKQPLPPLNFPLQTLPCSPPAP